MSQSAVPRPLTFLEFAPRIGVKLEPGQRALARVGFDGGVPSSDLERKVYGSFSDAPTVARDVFVAVCGARSGKSTAMGGTRLLHCALTADIEGVDPGEEVLAAVIAPRLDLAKITFGWIRERIHTTAMRSLVDRETEEAIVLKRPGTHDGRPVVRRVRITMMPATAGGAALRGRWHAGALLDEACFFRDSGFAVNDEEIFKAIRPRLRPGGQLLMVSTPWLRSGLVYELWRTDYAAPQSAIVAHAPTDLMRTDPVILSVSAAERARDADNWAREYGASFAAAGSTAFFDDDTIDRCLGHAIDEPQPRDVVTAGADFGFVRDSSAIAICSRRGETYSLIELGERRPRESEPLKPSEVVTEFASVMRRRRVDVLVADAHYQEAIREHLYTHGLALRAAPGGQAGKADTYMRARSLMREGKVRLPHDANLLRQLREVTARPISGGGLSLSSPRGPGGHGDLVSALVLALWQAYGAEMREPLPDPGTSEWWAAEEKRLEDAEDEARAARGREWWRRR